MTWDGANKPPRAVLVAGATTDASGGFTLTHNLGYVPTLIDVVINNSNYIARASMTSCTATTVTVFVRNVTASGAVQASTAIGQFRWIVWP